MGNRDGSFFEILQFTCNVHVWGVKVWNLQEESLKPYCWFSKLCKGRMTTMDYKTIHPKSFKYFLLLLFVLLAFFNSFRIFWQTSVWKLIWIIETFYLYVNLLYYAFPLYNDIANDSLLLAKLNIHGRWLRLKFPICVLPPHDASILICYMEKVFLHALQSCSISCNKIIIVAFAMTFIVFKFPHFPNMWTIEIAMSTPPWY